MKKYSLLLMLIFNTVLFAGNETAEVTLPWSGYWWPHKQGGLVTGKDYRLEPATLLKYDKAFNYNSIVVDWEKENHYNPDGPNWFGHCNGWACASILAEEPTSTYSINHLVFYTGDVKGLLTMYYQSGSGTIYGTRYVNETSDFTDISPLLFQDVLQEYLRDNNLPILMDNDPGEEIWTYPIYKYELSWTDEGNIRHSTITIYFASDFVDPDFIGTKTVSETYTYDLTLDTDNNPIDGEWTGDSINNHPDFLWYPEIVEQHGTSNPYITLENINSIINSPYSNTTDDSYELNNILEDAKQLNTTTIERSLDKDFFSFNIEPGEKITLNYKDNSDSTHYNWVKLYDQVGNIIATYSKKNPEFADTGYVSLDFNSESFENYFISIEQQINPAEKFSDNYIFTVDSLTNHAYLPHTTNNPYWETLYIVGYFPSTESEDNIPQSIEYNRLNIYLKTPIDSKSETITKNTYKTINIGETTNEYPEWLKFNINDNTLQTFTFYMSGGEGSMAFLSNAKASKNFILPHLPNDKEFWWYGLLLINPNRFASATITYTIYYYDKTTTTGELKLDGYEKKVELFNNIFPTINIEQVAFIKMVANTPIIASSLYGTLNHKELSYVPVATDSFTINKPFYLPCTLLNDAGSWQGIVIVNKEEKDVNIRLTILTKQNTKETKDITLTANEKWVGELKDLLPENLSYDNCQLFTFNVMSYEAQVTGFAMFGNHDKGILTSYPLLKVREPYDYEVIFPYITSDKLTCSLILINELSYNLNEGVVVYALDNSGNTIETKYLSLQAFEKNEIPVNTLFSETTLENLNNIKVKSVKFVIPNMKVYSLDEKYFEIIPPNFLQ